MSDSSERIIEIDLKEVDGVYVPVGKARKVAVKQRKEKKPKAVKSKVFKPKMARTPVRTLVPRVVKTSTPLEEFLSGVELAKRLFGG